MYTAKERMLNAYRGIFSDYLPCAPEFWFYYPAKVLGITMAEFQREVPHWQGMLESFKKYDCEGWGIVSPVENNPHVKINSDYKKIDDGKYRDIQTVKCDGKEFTRSYIFHDTEPFWSEKEAVNDYQDARLFFDSFINDDVEFDLKNAIEGYEGVGDSFLLEFDLGLSFFDFFEQFMGFQNAVFYFIDEDSDILTEMAKRYTDYKIRLVRKAAEETDFESYFIGCSSSCNALLGPELWRKWDKPYEKAIVEECHKLELLIHNHNHGPIMATVPDLVDIGFDCVCPFERPPGDIKGIDDIRKVRELFKDKITFNGNVHTVQALIQGTPSDVRLQVREIKEAFSGSPRVIIGTGDQVGAETPEENIWAMVEETRTKS
jgi:hypothetical protein